MCKPHILVLDPSIPVIEHLSDLIDVHTILNLPEPIQQTQNPSVFPAPIMMMHRFLTDLIGVHTLLKLPKSIEQTSSRVFSALHITFAAELGMISCLAFHCFIHSLEWWFRGWDPPFVPFVDWNLRGRVKLCFIHSNFNDSISPTHQPSLLSQSTNSQFPINSF